MFHPGSFTALGAIAVLACTPGGAGSLTDAERFAIADSIKAASAAWKTAAERADAVAILGHYVHSAETAVASGSNIEQASLAFETMASGLPVGLQDTRSQSLTLADQRISVLGRDAAVETAVGDWIAIDKAGGTTRSHFAYSRVWVQRDGRWRILHSNLSVVPLAPASAPRR